MIDKLKRKKILCLSTTGLGNAILYMPMLKTLRKNYPDSVIDAVVSNKAAYDLLKGEKYVDNVWLLNKRSLLAEAKLFLKIRGLEYSHVVTSFLDKSAKIALFSLFTGAGERVGFSNGWWRQTYTKTVDIPSQQHEVEYNLSLLKSLGISDLDRTITIALTKAEKDYAEKFLNGVGVNHDNLIGVHPGSGEAIGSMKRWPQERFGQLSDAIARKYNAQMIFFGGNEETGLCRDIASTVKIPPVIAAGMGNIRQTAALISKCKVFITNDSGLMHIAASVGCPIIALFGPTLHWKNSPWNVPHMIVRSGISCSPCYSLRPIACTNNRCMREISVDMVCSAIDHVFTDKLDQ